MSKYHDILELQIGASKDAIKDAFRRLTKIYHPDKPTGNQEKYKEITQAYTELMNGTYIPRTPSPVNKEATKKHIDKIRDLQRLRQDRFKENMAKYKDKLRNK